MSHKLNQYIFFFNLSKITNKSEFRLFLNRQGRPKAGVGPGLRALDSQLGPRVSASEKSKS